jgi:HEAT repeat protein
MQCFAQDAVPSGAPVPPDTKQETSTAPLAGASHGKSDSAEAWEVLSSGAKNKNSIRRAEAIAALGTLAPTRGVVRLVERGLEDKDAGIRELAARTLGEMRARSAIPKLTNALDDPSGEVSFAAARSLWRMGDRTGREVFLELLAGEKSSTGGPGGLIKNQFQATRRRFDDPKSLAVIGAKEAASSLFGPAGWGIKIMEEITQDRTASARAMSAILLGPDANPDSLRQLQDALNDKNWIVRAAAAQALGASRRRDQIKFLQLLLQDDKPAVRCMAAASILRLSSGRAVAVSSADPSTAEARPAFDPGGPKSFQ